MKLKAIVLDEVGVSRTLKRISHEIIEKNKGIDDLILVGIKRRGYPIAERLSKIINKIEGRNIPVESIDITFYRDDLSISSEQPVVRSEIINNVSSDKKIILVDDVLYTGRTARAAIDAVLASGRPKSIQLAVLVDRGHRELPIRADYVGKNIPTSKEELVSVDILEIDGCDGVKIYDLV